MAVNDQDGHASHPVAIELNRTLNQLGDDGVIMMSFDPDALAELDVLDAAKADDEDLTARQEYYSDGRIVIHLPTDE